MFHERARGWTTWSSRLQRTVCRPCLAHWRATGGFEATVAAALAGVGLPLCVVNPRQIETSPARWAAWPRPPTRSTREVIALFAERVPITTSTASSREPREGPPRRTRRSAACQIIEMIGMETNQGRQAIDKPLARRLARHVAYLQKELDIGDAIKHSPAWREAEALLKSVPCTSAT